MALVVGLSASSAPVGLLAALALALLGADAMSFSRHALRSSSGTADEPTVATQPVDSDAQSPGLWSLRRPKSAGQTRQVLDNLGDVQYTANIYVGEQKLKAIVDTGSFELLVFGQNCTMCGSPRKLYDHTKGSGYSSSGFTQQHNFGSGTTDSVEARDTVVVDGLRIKAQKFWEVVDADMPILDEDSFQAILGIGGPPVSVLKFARQEAQQAHEELKSFIKNGQTVTEQVRNAVRHYDEAVAHARNTTSVAESMDLATVSICLGHRSNSKGYITWDDHATQTTPERFARIKVVGEYYWSASLGRVRFDIASMKHIYGLPMQANSTIDCADANCSAVIDTGTSLLVAPSDFVQSVYNFVDAWALEGGTCDDISKLPDLHFNLNGVPFSLPAESYVGQIEGDIYDEVAKFMPMLFRRHRGFGDQKSSCQPLIMSMDADSQFGPTWILGMPFFRKYYTSFEFRQSSSASVPTAASMSFAVANKNCKAGMRPHSTTDRAYDPAELQTERRQAQLRVDASKLRVPRLVREAHAKAAGREAFRPFIKI
eukprot:CAMPEP_0117485538 /NCGR_PEP_ID=MMETSP0784-20121206/15017_1 /TAXON_ID=39447 /ORGANISM="" /LENGTH=541 /DNA_ID=CAMNT_0005280129 /DNA_START=75 /DNA_END=1700 /DNA_ORIENTATION=-